MPRLDCDVLVVGAGPAGSCAARAAAKAGARVVLLERRPRVGVPVQCAEYIPAPLLGEADVGREAVVQDIAGMRTSLNGEVVQELAAPGFTIHRDRFDQALAASAVSAGAKLLLGTAAEALEGRTVLARRADGTPLAIQTTVLVGADGPRSRIGRAIGSVNRNCVPAVQARVRLAKPLTHTEVFFDDRIYAGYAWLFPKGEVANVGLGMKRRDPKAPSPSRMLEILLDDLADRGLIRDGALGTTAGWIPAEAPRRVVRGNVLLVGDAAGHTHPITGAGVFQAVHGGNLSGAFAARAAAAGDMELLAGYQEEWDAFYGDTLARAASRRRLLEGHLGQLSDILKRCWIGFREYYHGTA